MKLSNSRLPLLPLGQPAYRLKQEEGKTDVKGESCQIKESICESSVWHWRAEWEADPTERKAAWAIYVELVTRIAVQQLETDEGILREALNSLYAMFSITRQILREAGPDVGASRESVGGIAIAVLNNGLRPFLSKWHPALQAWEAQRPDKVSPKDHEKTWSEEQQLRHELAALSKDLEKYANSLAEIVGVNT